jgi:1L-myo-inositol 1-phosphate cytidylyltransferase
MKTGIILAAGLGSRLCDPDKSTEVKPLVSVDSFALLLRTIRSLELAGCIRVVIVLGYQADRVKSFVQSNHREGADLIFVINDKFGLQNGISVLCARPFAEQEYLLTMADHILDDAIMHLVRDHHPPIGGAALCVDYKLDTIFDIEDATKVLAEQTRIKKIGKKLKTYNCIDTGVFIGTDGLMDAIDQVYMKKGDASLSDGVQLLANRGLMEVVNIHDAFWQDVDNENMLKHAEKLLRTRLNN